MWPVAWGAKMLELLWLIPAVPLTGFMVLSLFGRHLNKAMVATIGTGTVAFSAVLSILIAIPFLSNVNMGVAYRQVLWTWWKVGFLQPQVAFYWDPLSLIMVLIVTVVGTLIHFYSTEFMISEEGYSRFFAYMNLFVAAMLILVLADNLVLLYLGWEGVGLCSYLLIGFWYRDAANGRAARKAFLVTRIGDTALALGLFLLFTHFNTLQIQSLLQQALFAWQPGSIVAIVVAALILGGAVGKSAQLPLQTWLPDAMAGPTPVSALIHAATMVTAGVYLIARLHPLFLLAPPVLSLVAIIGAVTLLLSGFSALTQHDIKRVLAYSTISQIGYMFLALGVGAWSAAIFHLMTHAFFKALLFLGAGVVIQRLHHEHNILRMGGLRQQMPVTFWTFLVGSASLAGFPLVTAGFYSKETILEFAWSSAYGNFWLWLAGVVGVFLTALYIFRAVFLVFFGEQKRKPENSTGPLMHIPLMILAVLSIIGGLVWVPHTLWNATVFRQFLEPTLPLPPLAEPNHGHLGWGLQAIATFAALLGIALAYYWYVRHREITELHIIKEDIKTFWQRGWGFDYWYDLLLVRPYQAIATINQGDVVDYLYQFIAMIAAFFYRLLSWTQTGRLRWYAASIAVGMVIIIALAVLQ